MIEYQIFQLASRFYYKVNEGKLFKGTVTLLIAFKLAVHYQNSKDWSQLDLCPFFEGDILSFAMLTAYKSASGMHKHWGLCLC